MTRNILALLFLLMMGTAVAAVSVYNGSLIVPSGGTITDTNQSPNAACYVTNGQLTACTPSGNPVIAQATNSPSPQPNVNLALGGQYNWLGALFLGNLVSSAGDCLQAGTGAAAGEIVAIGSACGGGGGGSVTGVTASLPLASSGGDTPDISCSTCITSTPTPLPSPTSGNANCAWTGLSISCSTPTPYPSPTSGACISNTFAAGGKDTIAYTCPTPYPTPTIGNGSYTAYANTTFSSTSITSTTSDVATPTLTLGTSNGPTGAWLISVTLSSSIYMNISAGNTSAACIEVANATGVGTNGSGPTGIYSGSGCTTDGSYTRVAAQEFREAPTLQSALESPITVIYTAQYANSTVLTFKCQGESTSATAATLYAGSCNILAVPI